MDVAEDGEQARAMGSEVDYDLVILDLNLQRLDGVAVLRHLRLRRPSLPVLVLTRELTIICRRHFLSVNYPRASVHCCGAAICLRSLYWWWKI